MTIHATIEPSYDPTEDIIDRIDAERELLRLHESLIDYDDIDLEYEHDRRTCGGGWPPLFTTRANVHAALTDEIPF